MGFTSCRPCSEVFLREELVCRGDELVKKKKKKKREANLLLYRKSC